MATLPRVGAATQMGRSAIRGLASPFKKAFPIFSSKQHYSRSSKSGSMQSAVQSMVETNILLEKTLLVAKQENELLTRILRTLTLIEDSDLGLGGSPGGLLNTIMGAIDGMGGMLGALGLKKGLQKLYESLRLTKKNVLSKAKPAPKGGTPKAETKPNNKPTIEKPVENIPKPVNDNAARPVTAPDPANGNATNPGTGPAIANDNAAPKTGTGPTRPTVPPSSASPASPIRSGNPIDIPKAANDASLVARENLGVTSAANVARDASLVAGEKLGAWAAIKGAAGGLGRLAFGAVRGLGSGPGLAAQIIFKSPETGDPEFPTNKEQELRAQIIQQETLLKKAKEELDNISKNPSSYFNMQYIKGLNNGISKLTTTLANEKSTYNNLIDMRRGSLQYLGWSEENINRQIPPSLYFKTEEVNSIPATTDISTATKGSELKQGSMTYEISNFTNNPPTQMTINNNQIVNTASGQQAAQDIREELVSLYRRIRMGLGNY